MQKREVMEKSAPGVPTVRRILPDTSKKYYAAKTLLSVTSPGISALVDPDEWKVVQVWNENAGVIVNENKLEMHNKLWLRIISVSICMFLLAGTSSAALE